MPLDSRSERPASDRDGADFDASDSFRSYFEYNRVLRTWFVAFGIGGPALFLINADIARTLHETNNLIYVASLFLAGAASQVLGSLVNKIANWYVYLGTLDAEVQTTRRHKCSEWLIDQFWIDILIDLVTIVSFGLAIWEMIMVFGNAG